MLRVAPAVVPLGSPRVLVHLVEMVHSATAYRAVRQTFLDLGLPIQKESLEPLTIRAESEALKPLSKEEWRLEVRRIENLKQSQTEPWF
jgi:hypothetical protein